MEIFEFILRLLFVTSFVVFVAQVAAIYTVKTEPIWKILHYPRKFIECSGRKWWYRMTPSIEVNGALYGVNMWPFFLNFVTVNRGTVEYTNNNILMFTVLHEYGHLYQHKHPKQYKHMVLDSSIRGEFISKGKDQESEIDADIFAARHLGLVCAVEAKLWDSIYTANNTPFDCNWRSQFYRIDRMMQALKSTVSVSDYTQLEKRITEKYNEVYDKWNKDAPAFQAVFIKTYLGG
jgi:hypothetical protein